MNWTNLPPMLAHTTRMKRLKKFPPGRAWSPVSPHSTPYIRTKVATSVRIRARAPCGGHKKVNRSLCPREGEEGKGLCSVMHGWHFIKRAPQHLPPPAVTSSATSCGLFPMPLMMISSSLVSAFCCSLRLASSIFALALKTATSLVIWTALRSLLVTEETGSPREELIKFSLRPLLISGFLLSDSAGREFVTPC